MADDTLNMVDQLLSNEDAGISPRKKSGGPKEPYVKQPKRKKYPPAKEMTQADLELSGWNFKFDPDYVEPHKMGDVIDGCKVHSTGSHFSMACVYNAEYWIYGWGVNVEAAVKGCRANIDAWKKNNPGKQPLKRKADKSAADILEEVGL